jgi:hypothetical protein
MKNNKASKDEGFIESLGRVMKALYQKDIPKEHIVRIAELTELVLQIAQDEFVCSKCGTRYKLIIPKK